MPAEGASSFGVCWILQKREKCWSRVEIHELSGWYLQKKWLYNVFQKILQIQNRIWTSQGASPHPLHPHPQDGATCQDQGSPPQGPAMWSTPAGRRWPALRFDVLSSSILGSGFYPIPLDLYSGIDTNKYRVRQRWWWRWANASTVTGFNSTPQVLP